MLPHVLLATDAFERWGKIFLQCHKYFCFICQFPRERFRYHPGLGCAWHEAATDTFKCSLSYVHRCVIMIIVTVTDFFMIIVTIPD